MSPSATDGLERIRELNTHIIQAIEQAQTYVKHIESGSEDRDLYSLKLHQLSLKCIVLLGQMIHTSTIIHREGLDDARERLGSLAEVVQDMIDKPIWPRLYEV